MKFYIVEYRDYEIVGVFTSAEIAEKYIEQDILFCFGEKANISKYRERYSISIENVISE